jgi:hypothetical protein
VINLISADATAEQSCRKDEQLWNAERSIYRSSLQAAELTAKPLAIWKAEHVAGRSTGDTSFYVAILLAEHEAVDAGRALIIILSAFVT